MAPPDFGRSVNPISTRGDRLCPSNYYWPSRIFKPSDGSALEVGTWMHLAKNKVTKTCLYDATAFTLNLIKHSFCNALLINDTFYYLKKNNAVWKRTRFSYLPTLGPTGWFPFFDRNSNQNLNRILMSSAFFSTLIATGVVEKYHLFLILLVRKVDSIKTLQEFLP